MTNQGDLGLCEESGADQAAHHRKHQQLHITEGFTSDEKSQVQALARSTPVLPMMAGMPEKRTHDYLRHGVTNLFAAFNIADGTVISPIHRQHRAVEFKKFLTKIQHRGPRAPRYPPGLRQLRHPQDAGDQHLAGQTHPLHLHLTPTSSSQLNQVDHRFAYITDELIRRGNHTGSRDATWS